ncbi:MAG: hypothetical protein A2Y91_05425 [Chloroflexi bacterium RBG_13_54_8]|nr:MAG: hypothetical protein A2Y91_05425 [Chloroflexi bacterium RBG_13_54_8]
MEDIRRLISDQAGFIISHQLPSGAIPWYRGGITDPWDHVECAIALDLAGQHDEAAQAYRWLRDIQNTDGSWYSTYLDGRAQDLVRDSNYISYVATGVWYHYLFTRDPDFLRAMWPMAERGIEFVLGLQQPTGEIYWSRGSNGRAWPGAILCGSCCIWQSIRNGIKAAESLGLQKPGWHAASEKLVRAVREHPELFDKFGEDDQHFATTWFYPVLAGVIQGEVARRHILRRWADFVVDGWGCKCVSSAPWVTVAETCELIMSLCLIGEVGRAKMLLEWILKLRDASGGFKTGIRLPEQLIWPEEKNAWTSAGVIMAASAQAYVGG